MSGNHTQQPAAQPENAASLDYRAFLLMKRNHSKPAWRLSEEDTESDYSDDEVDESQIPINSLSTDQSGFLEKASNSSESCTSSVSDYDVIPDANGAPQAKPRFITTSDDHALLKISVFEQKLTKCLQVDINDTVWAAKQKIIQTLAKKLTDPLNYGFYCKKLGSFLLDHKPVSEYVEAKSVASYELRYKRRVYNEILRSGKDSRRLLKMQGEAKRKELMRYIRQRNVEKINHLIKKGIDPNFHIPPSGETPLTLAVTNEQADLGSTCSSSPIITALVAGGAHMDFHNQQGLTPLHVAVKTCNVNAVKTLLDLGACANALDSSDLTPLYHCSLLDKAVDCIDPLHQGGATLSCANSQKWTILHQVCRHGRYQHLKVILDILTSTKESENILNAQNESGNTALHVCALYNQEKCLVTLLKHGADTTKRNYAHQDAFQVAIVARNVNLASVIKEFPSLNEQEIALWMHQFDVDQSDMTSNNDCRRHTVTAASMTKTNPGFSLRKNPFSKDKRQHNAKMKKHQSSTTILRQDKPAHPHIQEIYQPPNMENKNGPIDSEKISLSSSDGGVVYVVCQDYHAAAPDHISVKTGETVTVTSLDKSEVPEGYCKGSVGQRLGYIPLHCIQAVKLRNPQQSFPNADRESDKNSDTLSLKSDDNESSRVTLTQETMINEIGEVSLQATSHPDVFHRHRDVTISKGTDGYGFVLRGAKSDGPIDTFSATARHPGLQYLESVEVGSNAYRVGLRSGDYVLKINSTDVTCMGHRQTVDIIRRIRDPIRLHVVSVVERPKESSTDGNIKSSSSDVSLTSSLSQRPPSPRHQLHRTGSIVSAIGKLDSVLAMEDSDDNCEEATATLRRRPISRRFRSQDIQDIFDKERQKNRPNPRESQTFSVATSRRLVRVVPPAIPADSSVVVDEIVENGNPKTAASAERNSTFTANVMSAPSVSTVPPSMTHPGGDSYQSHNSATSSKKPPPPPTRRTSRLTTDPREERELRALVAAQPPQLPPTFQTPAPPSSSFQVPQQPPPPIPQTHNPPKLSPQTHYTPRLHSPTSTHSLGRGFIGGPPRQDLSGIAATVAAQAQERRQRLSSGETAEKVASVSITHNLVSKPPPAIARKPDRKSDSHNRVTANGESALSIALAAKQESLRQRSQTEPQMQTVATTKAPSSPASQVQKSNKGIPKPTAEEMRELMQLPPPPPTPPQQPSVPYNLPPPPPPTSQPHAISNHDQMILPPPPDTMLGATIAPPANFAVNNKPSKAPSTSFQPAKLKDHLLTTNDRYNTQPSNGLDNVSNTDSGVDDIGPNNRHHHQNEIKSNIETLSVVSSEEGSDVGVSLSYDPKNNSEQATGSVYRDALKKTKSPFLHSEPNNPPSSIVLTKVSFTASKTTPPSVEPSKTRPPSHDYVNHTPARVDVTNHTPVSSNNNIPEATTVTTPEPTKTDADIKPLLEWDVNDVCKWLNDLGLGAYAQVFAENEIVGAHLPELGKDDLQELGVTRVGHRLTIERSLKKLNTK